MSRTITIDIFDPTSVNAAIREIQEYSKWVQSKTVELRERIGYFIAKDASSVFNTAVADDLIGEGFIAGSVDVVVNNNGDVTVVMAKGKDAVFMEFGAGVYSNGSVGSSPNPLGAGLGYTIGSYGKGNGAKEIWGFKDANGDLHLTHGTPASMPMYKALTSVVNDIEQIAREVFSS